MGYRIVYGPEKKPVLQGKSNVRLRTMIAAMLFAFALTVKFTWRDGAAILREYLLPGKQTATEQAFNLLCRDLREGEPVSEAVWVFCDRIIHESAED